MHCIKCGAYFVRYPCPDCGQKEIEMPVEDEDNKQISIIIQEESLQKPSELKGGSVASPVEDMPEDPSLLKPSELNPDKLIDPTDPYNEKDGSEALIKPSQILHGNVRTTSKVKITSANLQLQPINETVHDIDLNSTSMDKPQRLEGETDEEYKKRVTDTLLEVMSLLEELIDKE
ncbi:MAG: hypothetical protein ACW99A_13040 [Candidatus Kariarchaeaceae archaeon]|jgi:hypothetical protein